MIETDGHSMANAADLRPGTLVFLWPPDSRPYETPTRPIVAQVTGSNTNTIWAFDRDDGDARRPDQYDVGLDRPASMRWTWETYAQPRRSGVTAEGIPTINSAAMTLCERIARVCGPQDTLLTVRLKNGDSIVGHLAGLIMGRDDDWEAEWVEFRGALNPRGEQLVHVVRAEEIAGFTRAVPHD